MTDFRALCEDLADLVDNCWAEAAMKKQLSGLGYAREIAKKTLEWAAPILRQQGADMELDACCEWLSVPCPSYGRELRDARRPKPPSLKEQALLQLDTLSADLAIHGRGCDLSQIRRALEQLND